MAIFVDSSIWIAASNKRNKEFSELSKLIKQDEPLLLIRAIQTEVCQGARTELQFHQLWNAFLGFHFVDVEDRHWGASAWNYFKCKKKGITLGTLDCLIGTMAKESSAPLWTLDKTLLRASSVIGFEIYE
ncbi:MAG: PIN domain-containing protein [Bacteriovoracia bacterium]